MEPFQLVLGILTLFFFLTGFIFLLMSRKTKQSRKSWLTTTGTIIKKEKHYIVSLSKIINRESFVSNQPDNAPTFRYEINGIEYETTSKVEQKPGFKIGSTVEILYNPEDPQQAVINTFIQKLTFLNLIGKIFIALSVVLLFITLLIFVLN